VPAQCERRRWLPISPEELKMISEPKAPGAPAIIPLPADRPRHSSSRTPHESTTGRERYLQKKGGNTRDVEIPFFKEPYEYSRH